MSETSGGSTGTDAVGESLDDIVEDSPFHVGIATPDVEGVMAALGPLLGLSWVALDRPPVMHQTPAGPICPASQVVWSAEGLPHVELVKAEAGSLYPPELGTRLHHVGYWARDLRRAITAHQDRGWTMEASLLDDEGDPTAFAYLSKPGQLWVELVDARNRAGLLATLSGTPTSWYVRS